MEENIEVEYRPVKKIVILDLICLKQKHLFERVSAIRMTGQPMTLNWVNGLIFLAIPANPDINEVNENTTKGVVYFAAVIYSEMSYYKSEVQSGVDRIPVIDQSESPVFNTLVKWIKKRKNKS